MATYFCVTSTQFYGEFDNDVTKIVHRKIAVKVFFNYLVTIKGGKIYSLFSRFIWKETAAYMRLVLTCSTADEYGKGGHSTTHDLA